jgi:hypothetical protein
MCIEGNLGYVRKTPTQEPTAKDAAAWEKIYDEYLKKYGLGEVYKKYLETLRKKALLETDYVIKRSRFELTKIEIIEVKLLNILKSAGTGMKPEEALAYISQMQGYHIEPEKISAGQYFILLEKYGKASKKK